MNRFSLLCLILFSSTLSRAQVGSTRIRDVIYAKHDGVALTMDVIKPAKPNGCGIVSIVSGGWQSSHEGIGSGSPFIDRGYVVFYVVHGSQPRFLVEEIIADIHRAVRFIRFNAHRYGVRPDKIGITGASAGAHLSLMLATRGDSGDPQARDSVNQVSSAVQAAACFYPPTDFLNWRYEGDDAVGVGARAERAPAFGPRCATREGRIELGHAISPIYGVTAAMPPVLIVHGDADPTVPIFQAYRFQNRCQEVGVLCTVRAVPGGLHGGWPSIAADRNRLADWFDKHLRDN